MSVKYVTMGLISQVDKGAYSNIVLNDAFREFFLSPKEKAFMTEIFYGVIRNKKFLDYIINIYTKDIRKECEELWAKNKYYVLSKSHKAYLEIRKYLKEKEVDIVFINEKIQEVKDLKESKRDFSNAILHIWGYFKKEASEIEKQGLFNILEEYMQGKKNQKSVIEYINSLLKKYPNKYLQESTLLTGEQDETMA